MARPEFLEDRPGWAGGKLNATTLLLEPLAEAEATQLLAALAGPCRCPRRRPARSPGRPAATPVPRGAAGLAGRGGPAAPPGRPLGHRRPRQPRHPAQHPGAAHRPPRPAASRRAGGGTGRGGRPGVRPDRRGRAVPAVGPGPGPGPPGGPGPPRAAPPGAGPAHRRPGVPVPPPAAARRRLRLHPQADAGRPARPVRRLGERIAGPRLREIEEIIGYHLEQAWRYRVELGFADERNHRLAAAAARHLGAAGRRALGRGDLPAASKLLERAVSLLPAAATRAAWSCSSSWPTCWWPPASSPAPRRSWARSRRPPPTAATSGWPPTPRWRGCGWPSGWPPTWTPTPSRGRPGRPSPPSPTSRTSAANPRPGGCWPRPRLPALPHRRGRGGRRD